MKLKVLYQSPDYYAVCESDRSERLVLYAIAGGIAMYEIIVELLPSEEEEFREKGHLDYLARTVCQNESQYGSRILRPLNKSDRVELVRAI